MYFSSGSRLSDDHCLEDRIDGRVFGYIYRLYNARQKQYGVAINTPYYTLSIGYLVHGSEGGGPPFSLGSFLSSQRTKYCFLDEIV